jgi:hypothetical protein
MKSCPLCGNDARTLRTRRAFGQLIRAYRCKACLNTWDEPCGPATPPTPRDTLPERAIVDILTSGCSTDALATRHGKSITTIRKILRGELYADACPHIPRPRATVWHPPEAGHPHPEPAGLTCRDCIHWLRPDKPCDLGHIDPVMEGLGFAMDCSTFTPALRPAP